MINENDWNHVLGRGVSSILSTAASRLDAYVPKTVKPRQKTVKPSFMFSRKKLQQGLDNGLSLQSILQA